MRRLAGGAALVALLSGAALGQTTTTPATPPAGVLGPMKMQNGRPYVDMGRGKYVPVMGAAGDTMTGPLTMNGTFPNAQFNGAGSSPTAYLDTGSHVNGINFSNSTLSGAFLIGPGSYLTVLKDSMTLADASTVWTTPSSQANSIRDTVRVTIGIYPLTSEFGSATVSSTSAIVGAVAPPSNSTIYQAQAVAGYALSGSMSTSAVGVFGQLLMASTSIGGDGLNAVCVNGPQQTSTFGFDIPVAISCVESDVNLQKKTDGTAPTGNVYGFVAAGNSSAQSQGLFNAYDVHPAGALTGVRWKRGVFMAPGAVDIAIELSALNASGTSPSQAIFGNFNNGVSGNLAALMMQLDSGGNLILGSYAGAAVIGRDSAGLSLFSANGTAFAVPGNLQGSFVKWQVMTYAAVMSNRPCNGSNLGLTAIISDSTTATPNTTVSGGGNLLATIVCNGGGYAVVGG